MGDRLAKYPQNCSKKVDWSSADPSKWQFREVEYNGGYSLTAGKKPQIDNVTGPIKEGKQKLKSNPAKYLGIFYQSNMIEWPPDEQQYSLVGRNKSGFEVQEQPGGGFTWVKASFMCLEPMVKIKPDTFT